MMKKQMILSSVFMSALIMVWLWAVASLVSLNVLPSSLSPWLLAIGLIGLPSLAFSMTDSIWPRPSGLSTEDGKNLLKSKIFWIAMLNLVAVIVKILFNVDIDTETQAEVLALDWSNILQASLSVVLLAIRKYDILKLIK